MYHDDNHEKRNQNIFEITFGYGGRMGWQWQWQRHYGRKNYSELAVQRCKRILGNQLQSRKIARQKQEAMIGCGVLNKMTSLGMPENYKI